MSIQALTPVPTPTLELWPHQTRALERFKHSNHIFLNWEMGGGKTLEALLLKKPQKTLIFAPLSVVFNWEKEIAHLDPELAKRTVVLSGPGKKKQTTFDNTYKDVLVYVVNLESIRGKHGKPLLDRLYHWRPKTLIVDESQRCKDREAQQTKCATQIAHHCEQVILLSGTPVTNKAEDIWAQVNLFGPGKYLPANYYEFMGRYFVDKNARWKNRDHYFPDWQLSPARMEDFKAALAPVLDVVKLKDVLEMPPLIRMPRYISLTDKLRKPYLELEKHFVATLQDGVVSVDMALTKALRLLQLCSGVVKTDGGDEFFYETEKLEALSEILTDSAQAKTIIWTPWVATYAPISALLSKLKLGHVLITGDITSPKLRQELIDDFQENEDTRVLVANPASLGVGVNLQAASQMVYFAKTYNLEHDLQSEKRCHRGNSTHEKILRFDLITKDTIEERVEEALSSKQSLADYILSQRRNYMEAA